MTNAETTYGTATADAGSGYAEAAERGDLPLLPRERLWGFWEFTYANSALAIATWAFLIGGAVGLFVGPREGIAAIVIGNIIGVVLTALPPAFPRANTASSNSPLCAASSGRTAAAWSISWQWCS
jgi:NCS1 family nucleobase:cation symporter-1